MRTFPGATEDMVKVDAMTTVDHDIASDLGTLGAAVAELAELSNVVVGRIRPILRPEKPRPEDGDADADREPAVPRSLLAHDLIELRDRVERIRLTLARAYDRIEI